MTVSFVLTFLVRFAWIRFGNDHFTHLTRARQILFGEWPIRDFFDPGQFLHYYLSALALWATDGTLLGEAFLTAGFMALGAALTYGVCTRCSRSTPVAILLTTLSVVAFPRLYNYPKVFLYPAALWLAWWFVERPTRPRAWALAGFTVLAFLFRFDHGIYIGLFMTALLLLVHLGQPAAQRATVTAYLVGCLLFALPFVGYVQWATGVPAYVASSLSPVRTVGRVARRLPDVALAAAPAPATPETARFTRALSNVDRWLTRETALAWFTAATAAVPALVLILGVWAWARGSVNRAEGAFVVAAAALGLVITRTLVGNDPNARLADVVAPTVVLASWAAGWLMRVSDGVWIRATATRVMLSAIFLATFWSVSTQAQLNGKLSDMDVREGPRAAWANIVKIYGRLQLRPMNFWVPPGEEGAIEALASYANRCTAPTDRLLIVGAFAPEVFFYAERLFAGGQVHFLPRWHDSPADQQLTLDRLRAEHVPIGLMGESEERFRLRFPTVAAYVDEHYEQVPFTFSDNATWRVLVSRADRPSSTDPQLRLPCFVDTAAARTTGD